MDARFAAKNGLDNKGNSITNVGTNGSELAIAGAQSVTLTATGPTTVTLPTTGTLATTAAVALKADLASPVFTGTPTAPTAVVGADGTTIATTGFVQDAVNGRLVKSVAGGVTVTLTAAEAGWARLAFTGALTADISVVVPNTEARWDVANLTTGAFTLTVKTTAGTGVVVTQGLRTSLSCDAVNVYETFTDFKDIALTGVSTAPTAIAGTNTTQLATTAFVTAADALKANIASPTFTGTTTASTINAAALRVGLTAAWGYTQLVAGGVGNSGYLMFMSHTGQVRQGYIGFSTTNAAQDAGTIPYVAGTHAFSGIVTGATAAPGTNTTQFATTAFVAAAAALKANLAGPTFTGVPAAPTAAALTNTTQLATTAFVTGAFTARSLVAGLGMSGGGTLAADRTLTLGTPGTVTPASTNAVAAGTHTHAQTSHVSTTRFLTDLASTYPSDQITGGQGDSSFPLGASTLLTIRSATNNHVMQLATPAVSGSPAPRMGVRTSHTTGGWAQFRELVYQDQLHFVDPCNPAFGGSNKTGATDVTAIWNTAISTWCRPLGVELRISKGIHKVSGSVDNGKTSIVGVGDAFSRQGEETYIANGSVIAYDSGAAPFRPSDTGWALRGLIMYDMLQTGAWRVITSVSVGASALFTMAAHGIPQGTAVKLALNSGTAYSGLSTATTYYVIVVSADTFRLSTSSTLTPVVNSGTAGTASVYSIDVPDMRRPYLIHPTAGTDLVDWTMDSCVVLNAMSLAVVPVGSIAGDYRLSNNRIYTILYDLVFYDTQPESGCISSNLFTVGVFQHHAITLNQQMLGKWTERFGFNIAVATAAGTAYEFPGAPGTYKTSVDGIQSTNNLYFGKQSWLAIASGGADVSVSTGDMFDNMANIVRVTGAGYLWSLNIDGFSSYLISNLMGGNSTDSLGFDFATTGLVRVTATGRITSVTGVVLRDGGSGHSQINLDVDVGPAGFCSATSGIDRFLVEVGNPKGYYDIEMKVHNHNGSSADMTAASGPNLYGVSVLNCALINIHDSIFRNFKSQVYVGPAIQSSAIVKVTDNIAINTSGSKSLVVASTTLPLDNVICSGNAWDKESDVTEGGSRIKLLGTSLGVDNFIAVDATTGGSNGNVLLNLEISSTSLAVAGKVALAIRRAGSGGSASSSKMYGGASLDVTTGALTGSTGGDTKLLVSAHTDGKFYIQNRTGNPVAITYTRSGVFTYQ